MIIQAKSLEYYNHKSQPIIELDLPSILKMQLLCHNLSKAKSCWGILKSNSSLSPTASSGLGEGWACLNMDVLPFFE